jgi:hypothetical protein
VQDGVSLKVDKSSRVQILPAPKTKWRSVERLRRAARTGCLDTGSTPSALQPNTQNIPELWQNCRDCREQALIALPAEGGSRALTWEGRAIMVHPAQPPPVPRPGSGRRAGLAGVWDEGRLKVEEANVATLMLNIPVRRPRCCGCAQGPAGWPSRSCTFGASGAGSAAARIIFRKSLQ